MDLNATFYVTAEAGSSKTLTVYVNGEQYSSIVEEF